MSRIDSYGCAYHEEARGFLELGDTGGWYRIGGRSREWHLGSLVVALDVPGAPELVGVPGVVVSCGWFPGIITTWHGPFAALPPEATRAPVCPVCGNLARRSPPRVHRPAAPAALPYQHSYLQQPYARTAQ